MSEYKTRSILQDPLLLGMFGEIKGHNRLLQEVKAALPEIMARRCRYCLARDDGTLVVYADSQLVAAQMRYYGPIILSKINPKLEKPFNQVLSKSLLQEEAPKAPKTVRLFSDEAVAVVKSSGGEEPQDELQLAWARLGATLERHARRKT